MQSGLVPISVSHHCYTRSRENITQTQVSLLGATIACNRRDGEYDTMVKKLIVLDCCQGRIQNFGKGGGRVTVKY